MPISREWKQQSQLHSCAVSKPDGKQADTGWPSKAAPSHRPGDWASIKVGSEVLAVCDDEAEGWFEAVVTAAKPNDVFELSWRDYPKMPPITRHRSRLALLWAGPVKA